MFTPVGSLTEDENELNDETRYLEPVTALPNAASELQWRIASARKTMGWCQHTHFTAEGLPDDLITARLVFHHPGKCCAKVVAVSALVGFLAKAVASE